MSVEIPARESLMLDEILWLAPARELCLTVEDQFRSVSQNNPAGTAVNWGNLSAD
jgi:hypothetical protein